MNRYSVGAEGEEAFEPGSDGKVLRNRLGITDTRIMDRAEAQALALAMEKSFQTFQDDTAFGVEAIFEMHRSWLGDIYDFAGELRTVNLSKGGILFAPVLTLTQSIVDLDKLLADSTPCRRLDREALVARLARVHAELVLVHPFREGNGRVARWLSDLMAIQAGCASLDWGFEEDTEATRSSYFRAMSRAFAMDFKPLETLVASALDRAERRVDLSR